MKDHPRKTAFDLPYHADVRIERVTGVHSPLEHDLRAAVIDQFIDPAQNLSDSEFIGCNVSSAGVKGTEAAFRLADIRKIDNPVDDETDRAGGLGLTGTKVRRHSQLKNIPRKKLEGLFFTDTFSGVDLVAQFVHISSIFG